MQHKVLSNAVLTIGGIKFCIDNGKLLIHAPGEQYPFPLTAQHTHALLNLLESYKLDIIGASISEQRAIERKNREVYHKPKKKITDAQAEQIREQLLNVFQSGGIEIESSGDSG
jgi:hypothetical protein